MKSNSKLIHSKKSLFIKALLRLSVVTLFASTLFSMSQASAHEVTIFTDSIIANGQVDPSPIIEGVGFASDNDKFDFTVDTGLTKLEFDSVAFVDSTHMRFNLHGTALQGTISISADSGAFDPVAGHASNTLEIIIEAPLIIQTISFKEISPMTVGDKDQTPAVSSTSNLKVTVTSNTPSVCTIDFAKIHAVAAGTCSIMSSQPGDSVYAAAPAITKTFKVSANPTSVAKVVTPVAVATNLGSALYDPDVKEGGYASIHVAGSNGGIENANLVKLLIPPQATNSNTVFLISAFSSDEESAAGYFVARINAVTAEGTNVRRFKKAIEINIPTGAKDAVPFWSFDGISWHRLQKIESESLPSNLHTAYFVEADGRVAILSDYLMLFGFRKHQAPLSIISPVEKISVSSTAALKNQGGSGTGGVEFKTSTESICAISAAGVVTGLSEGQCYIIATKKSSSVFADARSNQVTIVVSEITPTMNAIPQTLNTGFLTHSLTFMQKNNSLTLDVGLCSIYANEKAELNVGVRAKNGTWSWKVISSTMLDENGVGVFTITKKLLPGQRVRITVNSVIQMESDV